METVTNGNNKAIPVTNNSIPISLKTLQKAHFALAMTVVDVRRTLRDVRISGNQETIEEVSVEFCEVVDAHNEVTRALHSAAPGDYPDPVVDATMTAVQS